MKVAYPIIGALIPFVLYGGYISLTTYTRIRILNDLTDDVEPIPLKLYKISDPKFVEWKKTLIAFYREYAKNPNMDVTQSHAWKQMLLDPAISPLTPDQQRLELEAFTNEAKIYLETMRQGTTMMENFSYMMMLWHSAHTKPFTGEYQEKPWSSGERDDYFNFYTDAGHHPIGTYLSYMYLAGYDHPRKLQTANAWHVHRHMKLWPVTAIWYNTFIKHCATVGSIIDTYFDIIMHN